MPEYLVLRPCHCGEKRLRLNQISESLCEVQCTKCLDFAWGSSPDNAVNRWNALQGQERDPKEDSTIPQAGKECCKQSINLIMLNDERQDSRVKVCRICGCKHIRMSAEIGRFLSK